jgi:hypothetical protein
MIDKKELQQEFIQLEGNDNFTAISSCIVLGAKDTVSPILLSSSIDFYALKRRTKTHKAHRQLLSMV